jgi:WD40 repeat protein
LQTSVTAREQRQTEEEIRRQQELETAQRLAETERKRAEEQALSAQNLRRRAVYLGVALVIAVILAGMAGLFSQQSAQNEALAATQEAAAVAEAEQRATAQAFAEAQQATAVAEGQRANEERGIALSAEATAVAEGIRADEERDAALTAESEADNQRIIAEHERDLTRSRELALAVVNRLDDNPELSILLALEALNTVHTKEAEDALHQAIQASHVRQTFVGHAENEMGQLAFTPDGTSLVSTSLDGTVRVWDVATGAELLSLENHGGAVHTVAIDPQGEWAVTGGEDGNARLWDLNSGEEIRLFPDFHVPEPWGQLDLSSDGSLLATPSLSNTVKIWDTATGELLRIFTAPLPVEFVEFSPDDQMLLVGIDGSWPLSVWQLDSGEEVLQIPDSATGWEFGFSPDGKLIQTTNEDADAIVFWDLEASLSSGTPVEKSRIDIPYNFPTGAFSPDSQHFIVQNTVYDVNSGEVVQTLPTDFLYSWPVYSPDGNSIAYGGNSGQLKISELSPLGYSELAFLDAHEGRVYRMDTNLEESLLATADFDNGVAHLWDIETGERLVSEVAHHDDGIVTVAISADGSKLATGSPWTPEIKVWDASGGEALVTLEHGPPSTDYIYLSGIAHVDFNPVDGRYLASAGADGTARIWEWETGELVHLFEPHPEKYAVLLAEFSPDGAHLAAATNSPQALIKIWDVESGEEFLTIPDLPDRAANLRFSPDGRFIAAGGTAGWLRLWDATTGEEVVQLTGHPGTILGIVFTSDSKRLITAGGGNQVRIWDTATGAELSRLNLTYPVNDVQVLADDSGLVTSTSADGGVRFYTLDVDELMEIAESRITRPFTPAECVQYRIEPCPGQ